MFVSPNLSSTMTLDQATAALAGAKQEQMTAAAHEINQTLGLRSSETAAIGAWSDGAENTVVSHIAPTSFDKIEVSAAMAGSLANQKAVLAFQTGGGDRTDFVGSFETDKSVNEMHEGLLANGLPFHTLEPTSNGTRVYVFGQDNETLTALNAAGDRYGSKIEVEFGKGKFVGSSIDGSDSEVRADAQRVYQDTIRSYAASQSSGQDISTAWQGLRDRYAALAKLLKYSPNQPRDAHGRWTEGGDSDAAERSAALKGEANAKFQNIDQVVTAAGANQERLARVGEEISKQQGVDFKNPGAKTKSAEGIKRVGVKAETRGLGGVTDVTRIGFVIDHPSQKDAIVAGLRKQFPNVVDEGWQRNTWGYYDAKAIVQHPDGMLGEVQIMQRNLADTKSSKGPAGGSGHALYDRVREMSPASPEYQNAVMRSRALYRNSVAKAGPDWGQLYERMRYRK